MTTKQTKVEETKVDELETTETKEETKVEVTKSKKKDIVLKANWEELLVEQIGKLWSSHIEVIALNALINGLIEK